MAQPSIANYFATRKRSAVDELNISRAKKVLILDPSQESKAKRGCAPTADDIIYSKRKEFTLEGKELSEIKKNSLKTEKFPERSRVITKLTFDSVKSTDTNMTIKKVSTPKSKLKKNTNQPDIQTVLMNMQKTKSDESDKVFTSKKNIQDINEKTPPVSPMKNAMDVLSNNNKELSLNEIKSKLSRSSRLAELKASIARFNKSADKLKEAEKKTAAVTHTSPTLKTFKSIELEVQLSPTKSLTTSKSYLSPKKDISPRKNLFGLLSPSKISTSTLSPTKVPAYQRFQVLASPEKPALTLPYKYRSLAEMFRSIDTVCSMLFNRKETITFNKLKPAVQEMMRRNFYPQHFAQIKSIYANAFTFNWEKMKQFGSGTRQEKYEFLITPVVSGDEAQMNPSCLLNRKRILYNALIEKVKDYHEEFLLSLDPPMVIPRDKITRWHPEFDIEKVPDIPESDLPKQPEEEKITSGQDVLEKARSLFNCNTRMERALENLKQIEEKKSVDGSKAASVQTKLTSALQGIPKALLEKVRAKQAAKALEAMTRSASQDKECLMYSRLPELARLLRSTYVAEKTGVLPLEEVIIKLNNSYRTYLTNSEIEQHIRLLSKVVPGWVVFHEIRGTLFVKLSRDGDMSKVMSRLEELAKQKSSL